MSNGYKNGAFALGLVVGGGIILNLLLWSAYLANNKSNAQTQSNEYPEGQQVVEFWGWIAGTFIDPMDTIAQWAMAILSLAAVYLLWETLKASRKTLSATRKMAEDTQGAVAVTREIGEAQVRAYLSIEGVRFKIDINDGSVIGIFEVIVHNSGQSPALDAVITIELNNLTGGSSCPELGIGDIPAGKTTNELDIMGVDPDEATITEGDVSYIRISTTVTVTAKDVFGGKIVAREVFSGHGFRADANEVTLQKARHKRFYDTAIWNDK